MRAARTPPDPAPITKKSTSNAIVLPYGPQPGMERAWLEIDALLLHLGSRTLKDVLRQLFAPSSGDVAKVLKKDRSDLNIFLAGGTIKEGRYLDDIRLRHLRSEQSLRLKIGLLGGLIACGFERLLGCALRIPDLRSRPG